MNPSEQNVPTPTPNPTTFNAPPAAAVAPVVMPAPIAPVNSLSDPGKSMTIGGIVLGFVLGAPIGLVITIVAMQKSKKAGYKNQLALAFIIVFAILTPFALFALINFIIGFAEGIPG